MTTFAHNYSLRSEIIILRCLTIADKRKLHDVIYKILPEVDWITAVHIGFYDGSADDKRDGFIHFSAASQLEDTAKKYFSGQQGLLLVAFNEATLGLSLKWEASRGGDLFPHLYGSLDPTLAQWSRVLLLDSDGTPQLPIEGLK